MFASQHCLPHGADEAAEANVRADASDCNCHGAGKACLLAALGKRDFLFLLCAVFFVFSLKPSSFSFRLDLPPMPGNTVAEGEFCVWSLPPGVSAGVRVLPAPHSQRAGHSSQTDVREVPLVTGEATHRRSLEGRTQKHGLALWSGQLVSWSERALPAALSDCHRVCFHPNF